MFKRKKKKTGIQTPELRKYTPPPMPPVKPPKPPTSGSNAQKPPNVGSSVQRSKQLCTYKTPCGWCTKWDKKCDEKIGCEPLILNMSHSASNELLATMQDGVYKITMISEEQLERKSK